MSINLIKSGGEYEYRLCWARARAAWGYRADNLAPGFSESLVYELIGYVKA